MGENTQGPDAAELYDEALTKGGAVQVRCVEGRPVTRYGTPIFIGAVRDPEQPNKLTYDTAAVITLPRDEAERYRREYVRHIVEGDLMLADSKSTEVGAPRKPPIATSVAAKGPPDASNEGRRE